MNIRFLNSEVFVWDGGARHHILWYRKGCFRQVWVTSEGGHHYCVFSQEGSDDMQLLVRFGAMESALKHFHRVLEGAEA